jgi:excisionase family DNA binding protein
MDDKTRNTTPHTPVRNLTSHPDPFVRTDDLAKYWSVSRKQIYKQIEDGGLPAIRLGPRSLRISTREAVEFERRSAFAPAVEPSRSTGIVPPPADRAARVRTDRDGRRR